ncbi:hypothetical protein [Rhodopila globiformis]|uniref:Uncharacterized protein n=1 Tax=Rhodopila globiformis TaxID=1071 RepID=A0A2S6NNW4_RHOGL|nr:hypothetical protein [Rhodopila globiformis]PPQ39539.1 hypothetical protein CCS01_01200 [Rhodopila globiformis]
MSTNPMKSKLSLLAAVVMTVGLAAGPTLAVAQTRDGVAGTNAGMTTTTNGDMANRGGGGAGWWGLLGLIGLAGLYPSFRTSRTVDATGSVNRKL